MGNKYDELDEDEMVEEHGRWGALKKLFGMMAEDADEALGVSERVEAHKRKANDNPVHAKCYECHSELEHADVGRCPHCGYDASFTGSRVLYSVLTGLFAITIIGIPAAVLFYRKAQKLRKKEARGVANKEWK
ncbi:zinc ribbon domain-containing protein [Halorussus salinus]|uniref:zinc ribbon domain-containing protein n=1 Tax=Halorussus salinus TaxID=1364935 RepID=UPI0010921026|nr:zinc ribbon domain-containing protein [Halorussus salinus]